MYRRILLGLLACLVGVAVSALAAVTHDVTSTATTSGAGSVSVTHTVGSGCDNAVLEIKAGWFGTDVAATGATFNSAGATEVGAAQSGSGNTRAILYRLVNPTKGSAQSAVVTFASDIIEAVIVASSYCGVDQSTPSGTPQTSTGFDVSSSISVTSATGEVVTDIIYTIAGSENPTLTAAVGQTERANEESPSTEHQAGASDKAGSASTSMTWAIDDTAGGATYVTVGAALKPAAAAATTRKKYVFAFP